ncbi:hypothetical protein GCM10025760_12620 [Microbacterium yannicii]|uniref:Integral membrane protein n=1 Tax=Microbacterium yannicii TaxID=671622 RepID=A0ABP9M0S6_9MICO|nr:hypothetical protein [Microbacterium yannicii]MCO5954699.1 hypothetical protein [Microbacterium yannicii]
MTPDTAPESVLERAATRRADEGRSRRATPAVRIAGIYLASRLVTTALFLLAARLSPSGSRFGPDADLATYVVAWDAQYYLRIASEGYPAELPLTAAGEVAQNAWAFMPFFPWAAGAAGWLLGSWAAGAVALAIVAGYLCCLVLRSILKPAIGETAALWAVVFFACAPLAAMFQLGYAEAPFLLLVLLGIRSVQRRQYGPLYAIIPTMAFTRPGVLAFALFLGLFGIHRWLNRSREPFARREALHILALAGIATLLGFSWQVIAGLVTGRDDAYLATELAWRRLWVGDAGGFVPFEGWPQAADYWFRSWGLDPVWGLVGLGLLVVAGGALLAFSPHVARLGPEIRLWAAAYLAYLLAVFLPQSSVFRILFPLSPLWGAVAAPRSLPWRLAVLAACLIGQWWWIWNMYGLGTEFWHIP